MSRLSARDQIAAKFAAQDEGVQWYFGLLPELLYKLSDSNPALAYCFQQIEVGQRVGIYALLMREYRTNSELAWGAVDRLKITRDDFPKFFESILGKKIDPRGRNIIKPAEMVRDRIMHGRQQTPAQINTAILGCLDYVEFINQEFKIKAGFQPFGKLQGVTSVKGKPQLDKKITRAVLIGLGIN